VARNRLKNINDDIFLFSKMDTVKVEFTNGIFEVPRDLIEKSNSMSWMLEDESVPVRAPFEYDQCFHVHPFQLPILKIPLFFKFVSFLDNLEYLFLTIYYSKVKQLRFIDVDLQLDPSMRNNEMVQLLNSRNYILSKEQYDKLEDSSLEKQYGLTVIESWKNGTVGYYGLYEEEIYLDFYQDMFAGNGRLKRLVISIPRASASIDVMYDPADHVGLSNNDWVWDVLLDQNPGYSGNDKEPFIKISSMVHNQYGIQISNTMVYPIFSLQDDELDNVYELFKMLKKENKIDNYTIVIGVSNILGNMVKTTIPRIVNIIMTLMSDSIVPGSRQYEEITSKQERLWTQALVNIVKNPELYLGK